MCRIFSPLTEYPNDHGGFVTPEDEKALLIHNLKMTDISPLLELMEHLRDPQNGCPWDRIQTFASISSYTVEEAYEVADAIARDDIPDLVSELGDLLFHVVFHAQIAKEAGLFDFQEVLTGIVAKMTRRHPHVFAGEQAGDMADLYAAWETRKAEERKEPADSLMDHLTKGLPPIRRAIKLQKKAAQTGLQREKVLSIIDKLQQRLREMEDRIRVAAHQDTRARMGDILFTCVDLAGHLDVDPEEALREANAGFERKFRRMEKALLSQGKTVDASRPEERDVAWKQVEFERPRSR
uniref:ATP diphosphatase n=1 Tax=Candidatus Kentrum sp. TC TaxID=2126339 RepID=A0A450YWW5_9GAMM|nr:MAG: ATP diphosphatase [Candidatus Kentron sp. TC]VFK63326.1 MAG: ATP diphosphatase [Candidatus Kentron sp. TC]